MSSQSTGSFRKVQRRGHISNEPERKEGVQGGEGSERHSRNGLSPDNRKHMFGWKNCKRLYCVSRKQRWGVSSGRLQVLGCHAEEEGMGWATWRLCAAAWMHLDSWDVDGLE